MIKRMTLGLMMLSAAMAWSVAFGAIQDQGISSELNLVEKPEVMSMTGDRMILPEFRDAASGDRDNWTQEGTTGTAVFWQAYTSCDDMLYYFGGLGAGASPPVVDIAQVYDPSTGSWDTGLTPPPTPVFGAVAGSIDGMIYLAGGYTTPGGDWGGTNILQIYDPMGDTWSTGASMPSERGGLAGGVIDGMLYAVGGSADNSFPTDCPTYAYDPMSDTWTTLAACPRGGDGLIFGSGGSVGGNLYIGGDYQGFHSFYGYDPVGATWETLTNIPSDLGAMSNCMVGNEGDGKLYVFGGSPAGSWGNYSAKTYTYSPGSDSWTQLDYDLNTARLGHGGGLAIDSIYAFGGTIGEGAISPAPHESLLVVFEGLNVMPAYQSSGAFPGDTVDYTITIVNNTGADDSYDLTYTGNDWTTTGPGNSGTIPDGGSADIDISVTIPPDAIPFEDNDIVTVTATGVTFPGNTDSAEIETFAVPLWEVKADMPSPGRYRLGSTAWGDYMYILGGLDETHTSVADVDRYDWVTDTWESVSSLPSARSNIDAAMTMDQVWTVGGYIGGSYMNNFDVYDVWADSWSTSPANYPISASGIAMGAYGNKVYAAGGSTGSGYTANFYEYNIDTNTWQALAGLPGGGRAYAAGLVVNGWFFVIGGWEAITTVEAYDIMNETWETMPGLNSGRQAPGFSYKNDLLFVFGGGSGWSPLASTEYYDPIAMTWTSIPLADLNSGRIGLSDGHVGDVIVAAGGTAGDAGVTTVEMLPVGFNFTPTPTATLEPWITPTDTPSPTDTPTPTPTRTPPPFTVLLVDDDDNSPNVQSYYTETLDFLGVAYDVWDVTSSGDPSAGDLSPYAVVAWFTGNEYEGPSSTAETALSDYLDAGGSLFMCSEDYLYGSGLNTFISTYLHVADYDDDVIELDVVGTDGDPIGDGLGPYYLIAPSDFFTIYDDYVWPDDDPGTGTPFYYVGSGINNSTSYSGAYKTVFFTWPIEALSELSDRAEVFGNVLNFLATEVEPQVVLSPEEVDGLGCIGDITQFQFKVTNLTQSTDTFDVYYTGDWGISGPATVGPLDHTEFEYITVDVLIPGTASPGDMEDLNINVISQDNPTITDSSVIHMEAADEQFWMNAQSISSPRFDHAVVGYDGDIYVMGGYETSTGNILTSEVYDPNTDTWTILANMPSPGLGWGGDAGVINGIIYMPGDQESHDLYAYDIGANTWSVSSITGPTMAWGYDVVVLNGQLYRIGGTPGSDSRAALSEVTAYDPIADTWTTKGSLNTARRLFMSWAHDGMIYVAGGLDNADNVLASTEYYDPMTDTWTSNPAEFANMPDPWWGGADAVYDGAMWLAGGLVNGTAIEDVTDQSLYYDPDMNTWMNGPACTAETFRHEMDAAAGSVFAVAGWDVNGASFSGINTNQKMVICGPAVTPTDTPTMGPTYTPTQTPTGTLPTNTPTLIPTSTPTRTPTDIPTWTPTEIPTEAPTDTPTEIPPTPTEVPTEVPPTPTEVPVPDLGVVLHLSEETFYPNDQFLLKAFISNPGPETYTDIPFVVLMDVVGLFFWHPTWTEDFNYENVDLTIGTQEKIILDFTWPNEQSTFSGVRFYGALLTPAFDNIFMDSEWDFVDFGWDY